MPAPRSPASFNGSPSPPYSFRRKWRRQQHRSHPLPYAFLLKHNTSYQRCTHRCTSLPQRFLTSRRVSLLAYSCPATLSAHLESSNLLHHLSHVPRAVLTVCLLHRFHFFEQGRQGRLSFGNLGKIATGTCVRPSCHGTFVLSRLTTGGVHSCILQRLNETTLLEVVVGIGNDRKQQILIRPPPHVVYKSIELT